VTIRPVDAFGNILPVLSSSVLVSGSLAVTQLIRDLLNLLSGEWRIEAIFPPIIVRHKKDWK
jgi:hypothetical protein